MLTITPENLSKLHSELDNKSLFNILTQEGLELYPGYSFEEIKSEENRQYVLGLAVGYDEIENSFANYTFELDEGSVLDKIKIESSLEFAEYIKEYLLHQVFETIISVLDDEACDE